MITQFRNFFKRDERKAFIKDVFANHKPRPMGADRVTYWVYAHHYPELFSLLTVLANTYGPLHSVPETLEMCELQIARYTPPGDSYTGLHRDTVPSTPRSHLRRLSLSVELSGEYLGDGVTFAGLPDIDIKTGDAIIFNPEEWHNPAPVIEGERVSLIAWFYDAAGDYKDFPVQWPKDLAFRDVSKVPVDLEAAFKAIGKEKPKNLDI